MTALTNAQKRVLDELRTGATVETVAARLWVSPNTVKTHVKGIYRAFGVQGRDELLAAVGGER